MKCNLSEIFTSIQGEGPLMGTPCIFVRFSGCTLSCPGCDTKYHKDGQETDVQDIVRYIKEEPQIKLIVFTGGEPLLQQDAILEIVDSLEEGYKYQVETNGTLKPTKIIERCSGFDYSISPKLSSFNSINIPLQISDCRCWGRVILKFVISSEDDIEEVQKIQALAGVYQKDIYLMPEGATKAEQETKMQDIVKICIKYNYKFCPRVHILVWDKKRAV